jgi:hypothetical protein
LAASPTTPAPWGRHFTTRPPPPGGGAFPARYSNTCWSLIAPDDDIKVGATYEPGDGKIKSTSGFISQKGEAADIRKQNYKESVDWYNGIVADIFG